MRTAMTLALLLMLTGCDFIGDVSRDEVATVTSPDGAIRAILFETNGGATTAYGYEIELQAAPEDINEVVAAGKLYGATRSPCSWGVNLRWLSPNELAIEFKGADRTAIPLYVDVASKPIALLERPGLTDEAAPCGGMLANLG